MMPALLLRVCTDTCRSLCAVPVLAKLATTYHGLEDLEIKSCHDYTKSCVQHTVVVLSPS